MYHALVAYTHISMTEAEDALALRLGDAAGSVSFVRWLRDELNTHITEALRTWSLLTGMWEESAIASIPAGTQFVDLPVAFSSLRGYTLQERDLVGALQYSLWEPKSVSSWTGTEMFAMADIVEAIQRRRDQLLLETGCRLTRDARYPAAPAFISADDESIELAEDVMSVSRAAWTTLVGSPKTTPLWQSSDSAMRAASPTWNLTPGLPRTYVFARRAPHVLEFAPPPENAGYLDLLTVNAGATLDAATGVLLGIPDDMAWIVKWGALADLLSKDGPARDYSRSLFCERRWLLGVAAAQIAQVLIEAKVNRRLLQFSSMAGLDRSRAYWQNMRGATNVAALAGLNLLALDSPPAADIQLEASLIRNAPIPAGSEDLQIGKEYLDVLLGYSTHLAMFKVGGQEFAATSHLADAFFAAAVDRNERLAESSAFESARLGDQEDNQRKQSKRGVRRVTGGTVQ